MSIPENDAAEYSWEHDAGRVFETPLPDPTDLDPFPGGYVIDRPVHDFIRELEAIVRQEDVA